MKYDFFYIRSGFNILIIVISPGLFTLKIWFLNIFSGFSFLKYLKVFCLRLEPYPVPTFLFAKAEDENYAMEVVGIYPSLLNSLSTYNYDRCFMFLVYLVDR